MCAEQLASPLSEVCSIASSMGGLIVSGFGLLCSGGADAASEPLHFSELTYSDIECVPPLDIRPNAIGPRSSESHSLARGELRLHISRLSYASITLQSAHTSDDVARKLWARVKLWRSPISSWNTF